MSIPNTWIYSLTLGLLCLVLAGCGQAPDEQVAPPSTPEALAELGRQKSRSCLGCHGPKGIARVPSYPSIAGLEKDYLREQLEAFRSGERKNPMMNSIAGNLGDTDILALSQYYSDLPPPPDRD